ncbi:MAG: AsmA family protein [Alphaproteobacteria bacterium]|nr:AsmA family protein [Alphaproteobacteria bacterium]
MAKSWTGRIALGLGVVVALAGIAAAGMYFFLPRTEIRNQVELAIERQIGRDVTLAGAFRPSLYPVLGFRAENVSVANVAGGRSEHFATADAVAVGIEVLPFLRGQLIVDRLVLQKPAISLEVDAQGRPNWIFQPVAGTPTRPPGQSPATQVQDIRLRSIRLEDGLISQNDFRANVGWLVEHVDVASQVQSLDAPMTIEGGLTYRGERIELDVKQAVPRALMRGVATDVELAVRSAPLVVRAQGRIDPGAQSFEGTAQASGENLRRVAAWLGSPLGEGGGFGRFSVDGRLNAAPKRISIENATVSLDAVSGRGDILIETQGAAPYVSGRLEVQALDLNPYLGGTAPSAAAASATGAGEGGSTAVTAGVDIRVESYDQTPVDLSGMRAVNANLELTTGPFRFQRMRADRAQLSMVLNNGFMAATLHSMNLYGGAGSGRFEIDARQPEIRFVQELVADSVDVNTFLTDAAGFSQLEGEGEVSLRLVAVGKTQADFMSSMRGRVHTEIIRGAVRGVDLGGIARTIRNALAGDLVSTNARSPFTGMSATLTFFNGVAATDNLSMNTRDLNIRGVGVINLLDQTMDLRITPREQRLAIPFRMQGRWEALQFDSDLRGRARPLVEAKVRAVQEGERAAR